VLITFSVKHCPSLNMIAMFFYIHMSEFMKTVLKTLHQNSGHVFGKSVRLDLQKHSHRTLLVTDNLDTILS